MTTVLEPPADDGTRVTAAHTLIRTDGSGDTKISWDTDHEDEVEAAKLTFDTLKGKGYLAYRTDGDGNQAETMSAFDPEAREIIMSPQLVGG